MFTAYVFSPLCDFFARLFTTIVVIVGLLVIAPVVTLVAGGIIGGFYLLFMSLTRGHVRTINEVLKETHHRS